jgi:hypothetical protein
VVHLENPPYQICHIFAKVLKIFGKGLKIFPQICKGWKLFSEFAKARKYFPNLTNTENAMRGKGTCLDRQGQKGFQGIIPPYPCTQSGWWAL